MTSLLERDLVDYLHTQASRVEVASTLDAIENDLIYVPRASPERSQRRLAPLLALASAVLLIVALSVAADGEPQRANDPAAAPAASTLESTPPSSTEPAATTTEPAATTTEPAATTTEPAASTTEPAASTPIPLPDGAVLNGVVPDCTATLDPVVFECTIAAFPEPLTLDYTGYTSAIVDDTSHVSGGCRATNPDATAYLCYIGARAVEEQIVGEGSLGSWAPREYAAG